MKKVIALATVLCGLVLAHGALAAPNSSSIAVDFNPAKLGSTTATIHVSVATTSDAIAQINIFTGTNVINTTASAGSTIGTVDATAIAHAQGGLTLPLSGSVVVDNPAKYTTSACSPGTNQAVWLMNLSVAGQTLAIPIYVNQTTGAAQALGAYDLKICLTSWQVAESAGGAPFGAQLLDARLVLNNIVTASTSAGTGRWESTFTPYVTNSTAPNVAGTWEARAFVPLPVVATIKVSYVKKSNTWKLSGRLSEAGSGIAGSTIHLARGLKLSNLTTRSTTHADSSGNWHTAGHLKPKKTTYFQASASAGERDYTATGCQNPATAVAPAGCVSATLSSFSVKSVVVRIKR